MKILFLSLGPFLGMTLILISLLCLVMYILRKELFAKSTSDHVSPEPEIIDISDLEVGKRIIVIKNQFSEPIVQSVYDFQNDMEKHSNPKAKIEYSNLFSLKGVSSQDVERGKTYCVEKSKDGTSNVLVQIAMLITSDSMFG